MWFTTKETDPYRQCDKCGEPEIIYAWHYIYSPSKTPYYQICSSCYRLFREYIRTVPKGYEANAYRNAVLHMFEKQPTQQEQIKVIAAKIKSILEQIEEIAGLPLSAFTPTSSNKRARIFVLLDEKSNKTCSILWKSYHELMDKYEKLLKD